MATLTVTAAMITMTGVINKKIVPPDTPLRVTPTMTGKAEACPTLANTTAMTNQLRQHLLKEEANSILSRITCNSHSLNNRKRIHLDNNSRNNSSSIHSLSNSLNNKRIHLHSSNSNRSLSLRIHSLHVSNNQRSRLIRLLSRECNSSNSHNHNSLPVWIC